MKVYFVRHGKTEWNLLFKIQGWVDSPLLKDDDSPKKAADKLKGIKFDYICSSDLNRAIETKKKILEHLNLEDTGNIHKEFREVGFGAIEGMNIDEVKEKYSYVWKNYKLYRDDFDPGEYIDGFESPKKVKTRICSKLDELKEKYGDDANILVVSHGSAISIMQNRNKILTEIVPIPENGEVVIINY